MTRRSHQGAFASVVCTLCLGSFALAAHAADVTTVRISNSSTSAQSNVPVTFGQVFKPGDVPSGATPGARIGSTTVPLQVDKKATHADGSLRHGVLTALVPSLPASGSQVVTLTNSGSAPGGTAPTPAALLATTFDATISVNIGGTPYTASARSLLQSGTPATWLSGPLAREWLLSAPVRTASGAAHPHLQARFHVRAYQGLQTVRVEAVLENNWAFESGPRNYSYNLSINVAGRGAVYTQNSVNHYRQSRWRRVVWWGAQPSYSVGHDRTYLMATRAVPSYDTRVQVSSSALNNWVSGLGTNPGVMSIGDLEPNMPSPGGRFEIAPLPAFQAGYILSQDDRARRVTVGYGEQAGAWPMHYRDKATDQAASLDTHPNMTIIGGSGIFGNFPACGGTCSTNGLLPEASHHPSLAYLPYLITGDYYLMEELVFWGNWVLFYGEASRHGGAQGLVVWDQVRGQAWALRTLTEAAYLTPDGHPLKNYLEQKLQNNISYFRNNWVDSNPLGYITNTGAAAWLGFPGILSTWMDDFMTYAFGRMAAMGFAEAEPVLEWKAKFPVGRLNDAGMCWKLASTNWVYATHRGYGGSSNSGQFITSWTDWRRNVIYGWDESLRGTNSIGGQEAALFNAACASSQMNSILGIGSGEMIGWDGPDAYPANIQAAAAVAVEAGVPNAQQAWNRLVNRGNYPLSGYGSQPQWAIFPASGGGGTTPAATVQLNANPTSISSGQSSILSWSSANASSCTASGGWAGNKALSGSQSVGPLSSTTDFTLTCNGSGGSGSGSARVTVQSASAPTLTFTANPASIASGASSTLNWSSTNATSCTASNGWSGSKPTSGSQSTGALTANRTYVLNCSGSGGSIQRSATVTVQSGAPTAPTLALTASPRTVPYGGVSSVTWTSGNATACTASGSWSGSRPTSGSQTFTNITSNRTYTLQCSGPGGSITRSATVTAYDTPTSPLIDLNISPTAIGNGLRATLSWSVANGQSCTASNGWSGSRNLQGSELTPSLTTSRTFKLTCTGSGGIASQSATVYVNQPVQTCPTGQTCPAASVAFTATPSSVASGGSTRLQWNAINATQCEASGGWSGSRPTSGSQTIRNLRSATEFTINCAGHTRARNSRTVTIGGSTPPAPAVTLTANPTGVARGGNSTLAWTSSNATSCTASGGWNGSRATSGNQTITNIQATTVYTLACTGAGGTTNRSATVTVSGSSASLLGSVDSSYVDRFGDNRVYVFSGNVTPDDIDGSGVEPIARFQVSQDANACTFGYAGNGLTAGTYTIAFTQDAAQDAPGSSQNLAFVGTRQVTVSGSGVTANFRPSNVLTVGPGKQFATLRAAQLAAVAGSVVEIDAGTYTDDVTVWRQNGVVIRGVGGRAHIQGNRRIPFVSGDDRNNGMGLMVIRGSGISVENIEFSGARVDDLNGAGIRNQGSNLSVCNGYFHDNEDGFLGSAAGTLLFEYSEFADNGFGDPGFNHNVYVDDGDRLIFRHNYSHHAQVGHTLKTRARENHILYNRIMDEANGNSSYTIDVPNGGLTFVVGNLLQQGPSTQNSAIMNYGTEGLGSGRTHQIYLVNNSLVNDRGSGSFLQYQGGTSLVRTINNLFVGGGSVPSGGAVQATTNLTTNAPGFVNENGFDYRLTTGSPAINAGTAPGSAAGMNLAPAYQYVHRAHRQNRPADSLIDIGAYEFVQ